MEAEVFDAVKQAFWNPDERRLRALFRVPTALVVLLVVFSVAGVFATSLGATLDLPEPLQNTLLLGLVVGGVLAITYGVDRRRIGDIGLSLDSEWWLDLGAGLLVGFGMAAVVAVALLAGGLASVGDPQVTDASLALGGGTTGLLTGLVFFTAIGTMEELLVRGYLFVNVAEGLKGAVTTARTAVLAAVALTAGLFGVLHAANPGGTALSLLNLALSGLFLGGTVAVTGQLAFAIGLHVTWNFGLGPVFGLPVSGLTTDTALVGVQPDGPPIVTGGSFGPEGGLVMVLALAAGSGAFVGWLRLRDRELTVDEQLTIPDLWTRN